MRVGVVDSGAPEAQSSSDEVETLMAGGTKGLDRRYRELFKNVRDGLFQIDLKGNFIVFNLAFYEILGVDPKELLEGGIQILQDHLPEQEFTEVLAEVMDTGYLREKLLKFSRPDGSERWIVASMSTFNDNLGETTGYEGIIRDATEQVNYERQLEALHRHAHELVFVNSLQEIADTTLKITGEVLGFPRGDFSLIEDGMVRPISIKGINIDNNKEIPVDGLSVTVRAYRTREPQLVRDTRKDGDYLPAYIDGEKMSLSELVVPVVLDGEVEAVINLESEEIEAFTEQDMRLLEIFADHVASAIGRLREMERLRESEAKFRTLLEESMDAVTVMVGTRIAYANRQMAELYGLEPSELIGREIMDLVAPENREMIRARTLNRQRGGEEARRYEFKILRNDGSTLDVETYVSLIEYEGKPASLSFVRSIDERKRMESELREQAERLELQVEKRTNELQEAEKMVAIGELAAMVGHDLRNPLTGIMGAAYFLKKKYTPTNDSDTDKMLDIIEKNVEYSNKIVNDLLDYSKKIQPELLKMDLRGILGDALESIDAPANVVIDQTRLSKKEVVVDPQMMKRVFINMLSNAIDAMPKGGCIRIESRERGDIMDVLLTDTGKGISEEVLGLIWKPLFTTKAKGMGFGLSICKRLVECQGGSISVESVEGEGTTFTISLRK
ncbi:PAS domain S-box protein [Candidatus Bathyarchaeota archaeon]|nr:PAS domain S-box protein [Candidatus Bathyarchaeota archaeon]